MLDRVKKGRRRYFVFMDESGNNAQDRFFVLGVLMIPVEEIGELFDFLERISSEIKRRSQERMETRDTSLRARHGKGFEMKFKSIHRENEDVYVHILHKYFKNPHYRFSAVVLDRESGHFLPKGMSHWDRYINNAAMLLANNIRHDPDAEYVLMADQISQPRSKSAYEATLNRKIRARLKSIGVDGDALFGSIRIESHSSVFLQLVDVLVGAIGHDCGTLTKERKEGFMSVLRGYVGAGKRLGPDITMRSPNYFSVWNYRGK